MAFSFNVPNIFIGLEDQNGTVCQNSSCNGLLTWLSLQMCQFIHYVVFLAKLFYFRQDGTPFDYGPIEAMNWGFDAVNKTVQEKTCFYLNASAEKIWNSKSCNASTNTGFICEAPFGQC